MNLLQAVSILRAKKGCSTVSMAKELNVSRDTIYRMLRSPKTTLTNPTLHGICNFFDISLGELINMAMELDNESTNK